MSRNLVSLPTLSVGSADGLTRRISGAVYLDEHLTRTIVSLYAEDGLSTSGPAPGVNVTAVARHACRAERWTALYERMMSLLMVGIVLAACGALGSLVAGAKGMAGVLMAAFAAQLVAAWALTLHARLRAVRAAQLVLWETAAPKSLAPALPPEIEAWLDSLNRSNVVVYATGNHPFVGSGECVSQSVWPPIDISQPARSVSGQTLPILPFDVVDLHAYMARRLSVAGLRAMNRLYVRGDSTELLGAELLPDRLRRPKTQIPKAQVNAGLARPAAGMRTYLCLEMAGLDNRIVVSMFLHARLADHRLEWEVHTYLLPPLQDRMYQVDRLPITGYARLRNAAAHAARRVWPGLLQAPGRTFTRRRDRVRRGRELQRARRNIRKRHVRYDYGARGSLRELLSSDIGAMSDTDRTEAAEIMRHLQAGILTVTKAFLRERNVDVGDFAEPLPIVVDQVVDDLRLRYTQAAMSEHHGSAINDT
ncbi:hypothetical protein ACFY3E_41695 [Streptomyces griseorubiginosus]|uniref:hypothetical protein n=1 Tax=Streptomyces griseorubiginosus TaxID=67304 RepID=UPI00369E4423